MANAKRQPGDYIPSWWDDDYNREEYVAGHVSGEVAHATLAREVGSTFPTPDIPVRHAYMRSGFPSEGLRSEGCDREFYLREEPSRGAWPVTVVQFSDLRRPATKGD